MDRRSNFWPASAFLPCVFYKHFETVCACKDFVYPSLDQASILLLKRNAYVSLLSRAKWLGAFALCFAKTAVPVRKHDYRSDSLRRRVNARNVSFRISLRWPINNYWMKLSMISWIIKTEVCVICRSRRLRQITQTRGLDNSWYHAKTEVNNCFIIHFLSNRQKKTFSHSVSEENTPRGLVTRQTLNSKW